VKNKKKVLLVSGVAGVLILFFVSLFLVGENVSETKPDLKTNTGSGKTSTPATGTSSSSSSGTTVSSGTVGSGGTSVKLSCTDADQDGYCKEKTNLPSGKKGGDCNDKIDSINPGVNEVCDGIDNDCNGQIDEISKCNQEDCVNGIDDDGNGKIDCADDKCGCPTGASCINNACQASCPGKEKDCNGVCFDTETDVGNCGACGHKCQSGEGCVGGKCVASCPSGETKCQGVCVATKSDVNNCGACGNKCSAGEVCSNGVCFAGCALGKT